MHLADEDSRLIDKAILDIMSMDEKILFDKKVSSDKKFKDEYELESRIVRRINKQQLQSEISKIENKLNTEGFFKQYDKKTKMRTNKSFNIGLAAAFVVLLGVFMLYQNGSTPEKPKKLLSQSLNNFKEGIDNKISEYKNLGFADPDVGKKDTLSLALDYMKKGDYKNADNILMELIENYPQDAEATHYSGMNNLYLGNYKNAIEALDFSRKNAEKEMRDEAQYYYALCLTQVEYSNDLYIKELKKVANDKTSEYQDAARDILEQEG